MIEPSVADWSVGCWMPRSASLGALRASARRSLLLGASQSLASLAELAAQGGLSLPRVDGAADSLCQRPLILTGHQPVIFHPGLVYKYQVAEAHAASCGGTAVAIVIDTDEGDPGQFAVPLVSDSAVSDPAAVEFASRQESFSAGGGLYAESRLASRFEREAVVARVSAGLAAAGCVEAAGAFCEPASRYLQLPEMRMWAANTIVRRLSGIGARMFELPLTAVCRLPESLRFFAGVLSRAKDFHATYNKVLNGWRTKQGIRNEANPFPNLRSAGTAIELPFWLVDLASGRRSIVWLHEGAAGLSLGTESGAVTELTWGCEAETLLMLGLRGQLLVPRGALITASLRLLFGDLFVHGLGGGHYDPATDELIRGWWQEEPPPFAVASASSCLFPGQRNQLRQLEEFRQQYRDLQFNPGRYLDGGLFEATEAAELRGLLERKQVAVEELQRSRNAGVSGRETGRRIQQLSDTIRSRVAAIFENRVQAAEGISEETVRTIESRTWPWFYFHSNWQLQSDSNRPEM
ncbi:MAG: hypothetical protein RLZZ458_3468 [Planctomycetota bacterium]